MTRDESGHVTIDFGRPVGEGYYTGGKDYAKATSVLVTFNRNGDLVSAYPVLPNRAN